MDIVSQKRYLGMLLTAAMLLFSLNCMGQNKHAVLIGIGQYPSSSGWSTIHGDNDIPLIKSSLINQGFHDENITTILNEQATKECIMNSFESLLSCIGKGDVVYIHFSGHGQQITDLNGDEDDGYDEAWIPYDAEKVYDEHGYHGENHLSDDELNKVFMKFRIRLSHSGKLIVIADACHSGSGSRGFSTDDEEFMRGTPDKFILPAAGLNKKAKADPEEWLFLAACKSYQSNYEYKSKDGTYYGILSYVIATDTSDFTKSKYSSKIKDWRLEVLRLATRIQDIVDEGQPSKLSSYLF